MVNKCIFLDRDGIINELVCRQDGRITPPWSLNEFQLKQNIKDSLLSFKKMGYVICVVSNQPDVYSGLMHQSELDIITQILIKWLCVDEVCYAKKRDTKWYKPGLGIFSFLIKKYNLSRADSFMIGDTWRDIISAHKAGLNSIYLSNEEYSCPKHEYRHIKPNFNCRNIIEAVSIIKKENEQRSVCVLLER